MSLHYHLAHETRVQYIASLSGPAIERNSTFDRPGKKNEARSSLYARSNRTDWSSGRGWIGRTYVKHEGQTWGICARTTPSKHFGYEPVSDWQGGASGPFITHPPSEPGAGGPHVLPGQCGPAGPVLLSGERTDGRGPLTNRHPGICPAG